MAKRLRSQQKAQLLELARQGFDPGSITEATGLSRKQVYNAVWTARQGGFLPDEGPHREGPCALTEPRRVAVAGFDAEGAAALKVTTRERQGHSPDRVTAWRGGKTTLARLDSGLSGALPAKASQAGIPLSEALSRAVEAHLGPGGL
jgi:hypothetical protein